ncbi:hypothetical protein NC652_009380 [Populus alba x Populus x berolinensis]|nr:hypothetical protein NC652_009380 [Populus alba x Populus x berolinensis]
MGRDATDDSETRREIGDVINTDGGAVESLKQGRKKKKTIDIVSVDGSADILVKTEEVTVGLLIGSMKSSIKVLF